VRRGGFVTISENKVPRKIFLFEKDKVSEQFWILGLHSEGLLD
jgi:hypothetical protein